MSTIATVPPGPSSKRRDDIIEATLEVITAGGISSASLRSIAQAAEVSLGSVTHYFVDRDTLIGEALHKFAGDSVAAFGSAYAGVDSLQKAREATVEVFTSCASSRREAVVSSELYTLSLHRPRHRLILVEWSAGCHKVLGEFFDDPTVHIIDAFYEGLLLHRRMTPELYSDEVIALAVERMTPPASYIGPGS